MAEKDLTSGSGLPPEYTIAVIPATTLPLVSPPSRGLNTACSYRAGAAGGGNRLHRSQPPENSCLLGSGILSGQGDEAGFGLGWERLPSEAGAQRPSTAWLSRSLPGRLRPGAPGGEEARSAFPAGKLLRFDLAYRAFLENRTLFAFLGVCGDRSL